MKITETTAMIEIGPTVNNQPTLSYPRYLSDARKRFPRSTIPKNASEESLRKLGFFVVREVEPPSTNTPDGIVVVKQLAPSKDAEGVWWQVWKTYPKGTQEYQDELKIKAKELYKQLMDVRDATVSIGVPHDFPDGQRLHAQLRDGDRTNILGLRARAENLIANGVDVPVMPFRTYENINVMMTPQQMKDFSDWAFDSYVSLMNSSWVTAGAILAAQQFEDFPEIPEVPEVGVYARG